MNYTIKAIETRYKGHLFRSQLEATWAAFFDLCGWQWEYEPFTLNGWLPDFALIGKEKTILVEVKPVFSFPREVAEKIENVESSKDIFKAIFGCGIHDYSGQNQYAQAGFILSYPGCSDSWGECVFPWEPLVMTDHVYRWANGRCRYDLGEEEPRLGVCGFNDDRCDLLSGEWICCKADKYAEHMYLEDGKALWGRAKELTRYVHGRRSA